MRVCFLVPDLAPSGGTATVLGHARRLPAVGDFEVSLVVTRPSQAPGVPADVAPPGGPGEPPLEVLTPGQAARRPWDIAVATWWETAPVLFDVDARARALFLQSIEHRFYAEGDLFERQGAEAVLGLPIAYLPVARWMCGLLSELRPGVRCHVVPNGIDKQLFAARPRRPHSGPLRVLVEGQPSLWFKGVPEAVRAVRAMEEPHELTLACLDPAAAGDVDADRIVGGLSPEAMADLYAETDVLVKLARVEGLGLAPLEAFHLGVPCVATPYTGHDEYLEHGVNGLVAGFDDQPGTARALDLLARDRTLLARLSAGALGTAAHWPDARGSTEALAEALESELAAGPVDLRGLRQLHHALAFHAAKGRHRLGAGEWARRRVPELEADVRRLGGEVDRLHALVDELQVSRVECADMLAAEQARLEEITGSRGYRALAVSRRLADRVRR